MVYWTFSLNFNSRLTLRFNRHCYAWSLGQTQLQCHYQSNYWRYFWSKKMSHAIFCLTLSSPADKHLPDLLVLFFLLNHFSIWFTEQSPNSAQDINKYSVPWKKAIHTICVFLVGITSKSLLELACTAGCSFGRCCEVVDLYPPFLVRSENAPIRCWISSTGDV